MSFSPSAEAASVTFAKSPDDVVAVRDRTLRRTLTPTSLAFEPFRVLRTEVRALDGAEGPRCLGLVSAVGGEGVTTTTLGLALAFAQQPGHRTLVVEAGLLRPAVARLLGLTAASGLGEWLAETGSAPVPIRRLDPWNVWLLEGGTGVEESAELLGSDRMGAVLSAARRAFDTVLVDCPALTPLADTGALQRHLDGILLVLRARHAERSAIKDALTRVRPGLVQGVVFNDRREMLTWLRRGRRPRRG